MKNVLADHITSRLKKRPENLEFVLSKFQELKTKRGDYLLRPEEVCKYVYFIVEGCLQVYVIDRMGNESTREFYFEDYWTTDIFGFQNQKPSSEFIKCIEPCKLLRIHYDDFQELSDRVPAFSKIYKQLLEASYNSSVYRVNTLTSMDALSRVQWLIEYKPKIMSRLSSKMVASYLGIAPETFTRLKSKI